jgi:hypothetical protein
MPPLKKKRWHLAKRAITSCTNYNISPILVACDNVKMFNVLYSDIGTQDN